MRIERQEDPLLWIYLEPQNISYAAIGQALRVRMPNGDWLEAHVVQAVDSAGRTPTVLRGPFTASEMGLQVAARFDHPLPAKWRIDQLPLNVRFPPTGSRCSPTAVNSSSKRGSVRHWPGNGHRPGKSLNDDGRSSIADLMGTWPGAASQTY